MMPHAFFGCAKITSEWKFITVSELAYNSLMLAPIMKMVRS